LPTNDLKFILRAAEKRLFPRRADTLNAITTELLEREMLKEPNVKRINNTSRKKRRRSKA